MGDSFWAVAHMMTAQVWSFRARASDFGVEVYAPGRKELRRPARSRRPAEVVRPALGPYVLVRMTNPVVQQGLLRGTHINHTWLRDGYGGLARARDRDIEVLIQAEREGELDNLPEDITVRFAKGRALLVVHGPLAGEEATVEGSPRPGARRAKFSINGREVIMPLYFFDKTG